MKKLKNILSNLFDGRDDIEDYLAQSKDHCDLEKRQKENFYHQAPFQILNSYKMRGFL